MEVNYKDLKSIFAYDPITAIQLCENIICTASNFKTFREFFDYHSHNSHISTCQNEWSDRMSIHCNDCATDANSCVCLECFLNGNHQGHDYQVSVNSSGNCDCGDVNFWKPSGFCAKHHGLEDVSNPENYLDEKLRTALTDVVFKASFASIKKLNKYDTTLLSQILNFLKSFLQFGDGFRRLMSISLTEKINLEKFMNHIFEWSSEFNQQIQSFFGLLTSDELFKNSFAQINFKLMINRIIPLSINAVKGEKIYMLKNTLPWDQFWFHSYSVSLMQHSIENYNFDWFTFIFKVLYYLKEILTYKGLRFAFSDIPNFFNYIKKLATLTANQSTDQIQTFFDKFVTEILAKGTSKGETENVNDTIITTTFNDNLSESYFFYIHSFSSSFYPFLQSFKSNQNLKFDKLFEELNKSFDLTPIYLIEKDNVNENEMFIYNIINQINNDYLVTNESNYKSFINGASFFFSYPLFYSVLYLLRNDEICRIKVAQFLSLEKYQSLRIRLGIACLKNTISFICFSQSLVSKRNKAIDCLYSNYIDNQRLVSLGIPLFIPLLQLTIGLQCKENNGINVFSIKEFFAFEMAREIGLFDNDEINEENENKMIFSFLYLSILLVIERNLFNFDGLNFIKEQIIFELKHGVSDLNKLVELFDVNVCDKNSRPFLLNEIIHDVATARQKSTKGSNNNEYQDVSFHLKEGIEVNFISAINSFNREKVLMNNEKSKHPDELIKIQQFEPEETYFFHQTVENENDDLNVRLKDFLFTPTVLAIVYKTLRKSSEFHRNDLNDHLAMNILILISKFVQELEIKDDKSIKIGEIIKYNSTITDLITQLNQSLFNLSIGENKSATIQNTLNKKTFNLFIRTKICSSTESPKSIIDILLSKGELGKSVLNQMSVEIEGSEKEQNKQDLNLMKKNRARKMKEEIMTHFKSLSSNFSIVDDQKSTPNKSSTSTNEVCSICSMEDKDEVLSYPLYIYRTKLPFIFDKPPIVEMTQFNALRETDILQDDEILESAQLFKEQDDEQEDIENNELINDPEMVFARILSTSPHLDITNDLDAEEVRNRQNMIDLLHQRIMADHERAVQQAAERKDQKMQMRLKRLQEKKEAQLRKQKELENPDKKVSKRCTPGNLFVIQFAICQHPVHNSCVHKKNDFTCPIDRSFKNGFLPNVEDFKDHQKLPDSLDVFIKQYSSFFKSSDEKIIDVFVELVKSISGLITTFEVRLRSLPDCLDSKKNKILLRNLFLSTWHAYRLKGKPMMKTGFKNDVSEDVDSKLTIFQRFIKKIIESDDIEKGDETFRALIGQFVQSSFGSKDEKSEKEMHLFLRRVCLVEHFLLTKLEKENVDQKSTQIIDWDDILSSANISQKFNVTFHFIPEDFEFKPFVFAPMPKEFIRFVQQPFMFKIDEMNVCSVFNILDYNRLIDEYDEFDENGEGQKEENFSCSLVILNKTKPTETLKKMFSGKNYPSLFLSIGRDASTVRVVDGERTCLLRPFFLDKYGCTDVGFKREQPLFLSEEKYERTMDQILSGDFSSNLMPF
ncbi:hypothetical protein M9Y10_018577 [Tritrichomonas musculus]|uniref:E3 ubiquitin-protein ligase n=1 Tax=Tritrichomonas musculus TaxID=1915356 RepID=A0ABR2HPG6_9EUKA